MASAGAASARMPSLVTGPRLLIVTLLPAPVPGRRSGPPSLRTHLASSALLSFVSSGTTTALTIAASLLQPIFDGGRLGGQKAVAESRERELVETYRKAILSAFEDVEQALAGTSRLGQQEQLQDEVQARAHESLRLAEVRYRAGADDQLTVLDAQRTLFSAQDQLAQVRLNRLQAAVSLYKALGGGWSEPRTMAAATSH